MFQSRMVEAGYEFGEEKEWETHTKYGEKPKLNCFHPTYRRGKSRVQGKYLIYPDSEKTIDEALFKSNTGEIIGPAFSRPLRTDSYFEQNYQKVSETPLFVKLTWQEMSGLPKPSTETGFDKVCLPSSGFKVRTSFLPASSCSIFVHDESLTAEQIENAIILQGSDWEKREVHEFNTKTVVPEAHSWSQCTREDEENFVYSISLIHGSFSMAVKTLKDDENEPEYHCKSTIEEG